MSCKYLDEPNYLCAFDQDNKIYIIVFVKRNEQNMNMHNSPILVERIIYHDKVILYDTFINNGPDKPKYKILCATNNENYLVSCTIIKYAPFPREGVINNYNPNVQFQNLNCQTNFIINEDNC